MSTLIERADADVAEFGPRMGADWLLWCTALLHEAEGRDREAAELLQVAWDLAAGIGLVSQGRMIGPDHTRLLLRTGRADAAAEVAAELDATSRDGGADGAKGVALRCRALVEQDPALAVAAVDLLRRSPRTLDRADAMVDAAECLATSGSSVEAVSLAREALELYAAAGADRDATLTHDRLRAAGAPISGRHGRARPAFGWEALTRTELEVAKLAAQGLSNPEIARLRFVSPRTVESHVSSAFTKLGVTSRVALAAEVIRRSG